MIAPLFLLSAQWKHSAVIRRGEGAEGGRNLKKEENWEIAADVENCTKKHPTASITSTPSMNTFQRTDTELSNRWRDVNNHRNRSPVPPSLFFSTADSLRAFIGYKLDLVWRFAHLHLFTVKSLFWKWSVDSLKRSFMYFSVSFRDTKCERVVRMCFQKCWNY